MFWLATRASCPLGFFRVGPARKSYPSCWPYNKSFIDRACSVKIGGYWPLFFCVFARDFVSIRSKKKNARTQKQKKSIANIQTSWPHAWSKTHICWTSITLSPCYEISELSGKFPRAASFCCCRFSPSVPSLMHKAAFARDHSYLAPKGLTIAPH